MRILSDKPTDLKNALIAKFGENAELKVDYSPALDIYTKDNALLQTLRGLFVSSKLDFTDDILLNYVFEKSKNVNVIPTCHTCLNYNDFVKFCDEYLNDEELRIAYDVETTAAPFLSKNFKLAGFSLANNVNDGCYVVLDSIDYKNPDTDKILNKLKDIIRKNNILVFNAQHEYIATKVCLDNLNLATDSKHLDDAYAMALTLKTESFKQDVFKLKVLCHRLLGTENWANIIDDYIDLAQKIASDDYNEDVQKEMFLAYCDMLQAYNYTEEDCEKFINILKTTYPTWKDYGTLPYTLIPSRMIMRYGCYDACYLVELFNFFAKWVEELTAKLQDSLNKPDIWNAYEECVASQVMSGILTMNGVFISEERDSEVYEKSIVESNKYYNALWDVKSDITGNIILRDFVLNDAKQRDILEKRYLLPNYITDLIPNGFKFISTTPTFYSFLCKKIDVSLDDWIQKEGLKPADAKKPDEYKLLAKHLKPFSTLENEDKLLESMLNNYFNDQIKKEGSLQVSVFKPMSAPDALLDILTKELSYAHFIDRVVLFEYDNMPDKDKNSKIVDFIRDKGIFNFDENRDIYLKLAENIKPKVLEYLKKSYPYKDIWKNLVKDGLHSLASPIMSYIYDVFTATGCSVTEPKYAGFDFICRLKTCRKYLKIFSMFIAGSSAGYAVQKFIKEDSIDSNHLVILDDKPVSIDKKLQPTPEHTKRVAFGAWYASTAETGRWQAQLHNVPAGPFCKRRFVSRYKGGFILANDMSQAEVRELAAVAHCESLLEVVKDPTVDIHKRTASLAFDVPYDKVTSTQRKQTKTGIFSIVYGRNEQSLAQELFKGDHAAAKRLMDSIFKVYPEIPEYLENAKADVRKHGYLVTRRGCPIFVNPYTQENKEKNQSAWERNINNYGIQGGAAGFCTGTLVNVQKLLDKYNLKSKIICYIHDSIELDCPPEEFDIAFQILNSAFNSIATKKYNVPTASDTVLGVSMGEELDIKRLNKWHYHIEGNANDVRDVLNQFRLNYNVEIVNEKLGEVEHHEDDVSWIYTQRSELKYYDETQDYEVEIKLVPKF